MKQFLNSHKRYALAALCALAATCATVPASAAETPQIAEVVGKPLKFKGHLRPAGPSFRGVKDANRKGFVHTLQQIASETGRSFAAGLGARTGEPVWRPGWDANNN